MVKFELLDILVLIIVGQLLAKIFLVSSGASSEDIIALGTALTTICIMIELYFRDGDWM